MSKLIAIWRSPNSGKTTLAVKLALELDNRKSGNILVPHADNIPPQYLPCSRLNGDIQSIGYALSVVGISSNQYFTGHRCLIRSE